MKQKWTVENVTKAPSDRRAALYLISFEEDACCKVLKNFQASMKTDLAFLEPEYAVECAGANTRIDK